MPARLAVFAIVVNGMVVTRHRLKGEKLGVGHGSWRIGKTFSNREVFEVSGFGERIFIGIEGRIGFC